MLHRRPVAADPYVIAFGELADDDGKQCILTAGSNLDPDWTRAHCRQHAGLRISGEGVRKRIATGASANRSQKSGGLPRTIEHQCSSVVSRLIEVAECNRSIAPSSRVATTTRHRFLYVRCHLEQLAMDSRPIG